MLCLESEEIDYVYLFFFTKKGGRYYVSWNSKENSDEWLIKETKVKAQNKDYIYGYEYNGVFYQLDMFPENINQSLQELKDKGYKNIYYNKKVDEEKKNARRSKAASQ